MFTLVTILVFIVQIFLVFIAGYLLLLTISAWLGSRQTEISPVCNKELDFLILIPAHNEEILLPELLRNLKSIDYPKEKLSIHVVADNCTDKTSQVARMHSARVYERKNEIYKGKGFALQEVLDKVRDEQVDYDAVVIIDADSIVSNNFFKVMSSHLEQGERVVQSYYSVRNAENSFSESIRFAALAVLHFLRPLGRSVLGGSSGLKGNGMVFERKVMEGYTWPASITEDIELHMELLLDGERVAFAPDAVVNAEMPDSLSSTQSQATRWEAGRLEMAQYYIPKLIRSAWSQFKNKDLHRAYIYFDALMEYLIPPFSVLSGLSISTLMLSIFMYAPISLGIQGDLFSVSSLYRFFAVINLSLGLFTLVILMVYLLSGLLMVNAPLRVYLSLLQSPKYMLWKVRQFFSIFLNRKPSEWKRTARNEG